MAKLRELSEALGFTDVGTYIASGNVVLTSREGSKAVASRLEAAIEKEFGFSIVVMILTGADLAKVVKDNPFPRAAPNTVHVAFAARSIDKTDADRLTKLEVLPEGVAVRGRLIYLHLPNGYGRSGLAGEVSRVKVPTTVRNWRTITALNEMAAAPEDQDMKFHTAIKQGDKTATGIQIPDDVIGP